jgi:hypothetical protein
MDVTFDRGREVRRILNVTSGGFLHVRGAGPMACFVAAKIRKRFV